MQMLTIVHWSGPKMLPENRSWWLWESDYDILPRKNGKVTMEIKRLAVLTIDNFKTVNK